MHKLLETVTLNFARNVSTLDRLVRALFALSVAVLYFTGLISGWAMLVLGVFAGMIFATSATGKCSIYHLARISTRKGSEKQT